MEIRNRRALITGDVSRITPALAAFLGSKVSTAADAAKAVVADVATQSGRAAIVQGALEVVKTGLSHSGETLRRELSREGIHILTACPGSTEPPVMHSSRTRAKLGVIRIQAIADANAIYPGSGEKGNEVIRGSETHSQTIALNCGNPATLDRCFAGTKSAREEAVRDHPAL